MADDILHSASEWRRAPRRTRSRRPTAGLRASCTPTATPATRRPRRSSSSSRRPTRCCPTRTSASSTTPGACSAAAASGSTPPPSAAAGASARSATSSPTSSAAAARAAAAASSPARAATSRPRCGSPSTRPINGTQVSVSVPKDGACETCGGSGAKPGTSPKTCPRCGGRGIETEGQGMFSISQPCSRCGGRGTVIEDPCPTCAGTGVVHQVKRYRVNIPAGVRDGSRIRLAGKGEPGVGGGPPGDLYVVTRVAPSPVFKHKGDNLEVEVPITIVEAVRGGTVEVPTLSGTKQIRIPAGTRDGSRPAPARRRPAEAFGQGSRRHPLPDQDRDPRVADRGAARGVREARRGDERRSARRALEARAEELANGRQEERTEISTRDAESS